MVFVFDKNGDYLPDYNGYMELPEGCTVVENMPEGLYKPKLVNGEVVEGLTQEEIDAIRNAPQPKTLEQELADLKQQLKIAEETGAANSADFQAFMDHYFSNGGV